MDVEVADRLPLLLLALSLGFALFAGITLAVRQVPARIPIFVMDATGATVLGLAAWLAHRRAFAPERAHLVAGAALLATLAASLVAIKVLSLPAQTTNVLLLIVATGVILLDTRWTVAVMAAAVAGWSVVAWSEGFDEDWLNAAFAVAVTLIMAVSIHVIRLRDARRKVRLADANAEKAARLSEAYDAERRHARELTDANEGLQAFAYLVSHDLKEPIRAMRVYLEDLRESLDAPERDALIARALRSHDELQRLVQGLLEWSRASTTPAEPVQLDVPELLADGASRAQFEPALRERRAKLLVERDIPHVLATPALLRQALGNLILNAVRHNPSPEPQVRVYAAPDAPRGMLDLVVEDNGPGFPQRLVEEGIEATSLKGGFGLSIAKRAAERLGGSLHLENAPRGGGRAHVLVPRAIPETKGPEPAQAGA